MELILKYFPDLTEDQKNKFSRLKDIYTELNEQINVVSRKDIENLYERHVLHSLAIAKVIQFKKNTSILDVGCGGGFPGIPLAILFPDVKFHLVDSIGKKISVVQSVVDQLQLTNVKAEHARAEKIKDKYDFVVSRAVTRLNRFIPWVRNKFKHNKNYNNLGNGILYLKGGDLKEELDEVKRPYASYNLPDYFEEEFYETKKVIYLPF